MDMTNFAFLSLTSKANMQLTRCSHIQVIHPVLSLLIQELVAGPAVILETS